MVYKVLKTVALSSEQSPQNPSLRLQAMIEEIFRHMYFLERILHINIIRIELIEICTRTYQRDSCMKGLGSARRRSWGSLTTNLQEV